MKQGSFNKEIFIEADAATVHKVVSEFSEHHKVHPLIVKVERADDVPEGVVRRYFITDSLVWGPFKFKIRYRADILSITSDSVHTEAYQSPGTYVVNVTRVIPEENGVLLQESVTIKAPNPLYNFTFQQADIAHTEMLKRIKSYVEANKT